MLAVDEILVTGRRGGGGGLGFGSVSGALGMIPGVTLGSFGPRPEPEAEAEEDEIVVNGVRPKPKPKVGARLQPTPQGRPSYCSSTLFQLGKIASDIGDIGDKASTAFVVAGVISGGTGLIPALGFKAASGAVQVGGAALQALAGDPTAGRRAIAGAVGTFLPNGLVPKSLRNNIADLIADKAFGSAMDALSPESECSKFAN
jgi:hypothetical protein